MIKEKDDLTHNLLNQEFETPSAPPSTARRSTLPPIDKSKSKLQSLAQSAYVGGNKNNGLLQRRDEEPQEETVHVQREIYIDFTTYQHMKLFFVNLIETLLLILALCLSIYKDDITSFLYQLLAIGLLFFSMKDMGKYIPLQRKISLVALIVVFTLLVTKWFLMNYYEDDLGSKYSSIRQTMLNFGFKFQNNEDSNGVIQVEFNRWKSIEFELLMNINLGLLFIYYNDQYSRFAYSRPIGYVHHSQWLSQYQTTFYILSFMLALDTFFAQTAIQLFVLVTLVVLMYIWALNYSHRNHIIKIAVMWLHRLYLLQILSLAITEISSIKGAIESVPALQNALFVAGLILKQEPYYASITHILLVSSILCFQQLYETQYNNYLHYVEDRKTFFKPSGLKSLTKTLLGRDPESTNDNQQNQQKHLMALGMTQIVGQSSNKKVEISNILQSSKLKGEMAKTFQKSQDFDFKRFMEDYAPYVYVWVCRICMVVVGYFYHGYQGFIFVTWIILSFIFNLVPFVQWTVYIINPLLTLGFFYTYFVNIPGIFLAQNTDTNGYTNLYFYSIKFVVPPIEIGFLAVTLFFFILLIPSRRILQLQRDEFRIILFQTLSDQDRNFLFQLSFYVIKRLHVVVLIILFIFTMKEITIFYIGLMFFFIMFASSLTTYRSYGRWLVGYAAFFIWLNYLWSLLQNLFSPSSIVFRVMIMLTFTYQKPDESGLNEYFDYNIPVGNWITLLVFVFLTNINYCFRRDKKIKTSLVNDSKKQEYESTADLFEAKTDYVLRKKFPFLARIFNMFAFIVSEMLIIFILIAMGLILALQPATLFFWGFLIFSLILQTAIVSSLKITQSVYRRCARCSKALKYYSLAIIVIQVIFHFVTNKNFLAQYGWDNILFKQIGRGRKYLPLIGLEIQGKKATPITTYISQIAIYIMAVVLEDYFYDRLRKLQNEEIEQNLHNNLHHHHHNKGQTPEAKFAQQLLKTFDEEKIEDKIKYNYEKVRYRISYMIYQKMHWWKVIDTITLYFYLLTALIIVYFCVFWQISLLMAFFLVCAIVMCLRATQALYNNGKEMTKEKVEVQYKRPEEVNKGFMLNSRDVINLEQAHALNRDYMEKSNKTLLKVRNTQWNYQYWILIISLIIIYPTSTLPDLKSKLPQYNAQFNTAIFWLFWSGLSMVQKTMGPRVPIYTILLMLIFEKLAQRWQKNRFGCTLKMIKKYKKIDEQMKLIRNNKPVQPIETDEGKKEQKVEHSHSHHSKQKDAYEFITIGKAYQLCEQIEAQYNEQTQEMKNEKLKQKLTLELKRKYTIQFRTGQKVILEQISLLLLLLSCAFKANMISIFYLIVLIVFLRIKDKTMGMLFMSYTFGIMVSFQYIMSLTNLSTLNSPQQFPKNYRPYPCEAEPYGEFLFPWFLKVDFLRNNLDWTTFFGIYIEKGAIVDILFDFVNLIVLTFYFFNYGNPINARNVKVSFSKTTSLEATLHEYSRSMMNQKVKGKRQMHTIKEEENSDDEFDTVSKQAADDSQEYFLGDTYYLNQIKNDLFIYFFMNNARYAIFIGSTLVTVTLIFVIALIQTSFMSFGYMIICIPLILNITDYFNLEQIHQEGRKWIHPHYICNILMIYSFIDIAIQICYQIPLQEGSQLQDWFGMGKIYNVKSINSYKEMLVYNGSIATQNTENLKLLILKCFNLFFIFLQSRIYESNGFHKFTRNERRSLISIAQKEKKFAISYRFNNWKLQKIVQLQDTKQTLFRGVAELKLKLKMWSSLVSGTGLQVHGQSNVDLEKNNQVVSQPNVDNDASNQTSLVQKETPEKTTTPMQNSVGQSMAMLQSQAKLKLRMEKVLKKDLVTNVIKSDLQDQEKKYFFKMAKKELSFFAKLYLSIKKKYVNQILFITELDEMSKIRKDMEKGQRCIYCDLELIMIKDVNRNYEILRKDKNKIKESPARNNYKKKKYEIKLKDLEETQKFISGGNLFVQICSAIIQAIASNMAFFAYLFMIVSQIVNGGIISIIYPFAIFGFALMEEARPPRGFWHFMLRYTIIILFLKFFIQLDIWPLIFEKDATTTDIMNYYDSWLQFGLRRVDGIFNLFMYIIAEVMVLFCIMGQIYYETLIGLHNKREVDVENIQEARQRYIKSVQGTYQMLHKTIKPNKPKGGYVEEEEDLEQKESTYDQRVSQFEQGIQQSKLEFAQIYKYGKEFEQFELARETAKKKISELAADVEEHRLQRQYSFIDSKVKRIEQARLIKEQRIMNNPITFVKRYFGKKQYFRALFPIIKEQKPGLDLYAVTTFVQFIICIYILNFYTKMDAVGTQNIENTTQFSFHMVMVLFFQVFIMVAERYINRTNIRIKVKKIGENKMSEQGADTEDKLYQKMKLLDTPRSMSIHIKTITTGDTLLNQNITGKALSTIQDSTPEITLSQTKITLQQVSKYIIQWGLLIVYHLAVFWYFPLYSNYAIYGSPECNPQSRAFQYYGCFEFHQNPTIIIFYLLCCWYFTASALQIQYGLPDYRRGSILMAKHDLRHQITYLIFYNIPFAMELKTILDWCFTRTSLDVNQWLELVHINTELFFAKCSNRSYFQRKLGEVITTFEKYLCGCFCLGVIFFFLLGPFLMFSNLSIIAAENLVTGATMDFKIQIDNDYNKEAYVFPLFQSGSAIYLQPLGEEEFNNQNYSIQPETKFFEYEQAQLIKMPNSSETEWQLSGDQKTIFNDLIGKAAHSDKNIDITLVLTLTFTRPGPETAKVSKKDISRRLHSEDLNDQSLISQFDKATDLNCSTTSSNAVQEIVIPNFLYTHIRLTEQEEFASLANSDTMGAKDLQLTYSCGNYWSLNIDDERVQFTTFSDLISSGFLSATSIMGFYLGVAYLVGTTLRKIVVYNSDRIFICDMPNSDALLNLCDCIYLYRLEQNLKKEEELYFVLLECLRSPEMLKAIAGSSLRTKD